MSRGRGVNAARRWLPLALALAAGAALCAAIARRKTR